MNRQSALIGYSLVELVVALMLLGMIALAAQSGLHFGIQVWRTTETAASTMRQVALSQGVLRKLLANVQARASGEYSSFSGRPKLLSFDAAPSDAFERYGSVQIKIRIVPQNGRQSLELSMAPLSDSGTVKSAVLARNVDDMRFEYLASTGGPEVWLSSWQNRIQLPAAIRVVSANAAGWPPLVVHLAGEETSACMLEPGSHACRGS